MSALERALAVLRYCDCGACFAQRSPKLSEATVSQWGDTNTLMLMVTLLLYLPYYDVVLRYERHAQFMTLQVTFFARSRRTHGTSPRDTPLRPRDQSMPSLDNESR